MQNKSYNSFNIILHVLKKGALETSTSDLGTKSFPGPNKEYLEGVGVSNELLVRVIVCKSSQEGFFNT